MQRNDTHTETPMEGQSATQESDDRTPATESDGRLVAVGIGPGHPAGMTIRARHTLERVEQIVGYQTYIDLLPEELVESVESVHATPMTGEVSRTETAVERAIDGVDVALIGSGDPNVYALGGLVLEILESKGISPGAVDFEVVPGVPAAQSSAARLGAPLVNDSVSISLSDHLTPRSEIEARLEAVAREAFAIAIYNPWSPKRRDNYERCCEILLEHRDPDTPVGIVHGAGRADEATEIVSLEALPAMGESELVDMTTTIIVGTPETRVWNGRMVTPRGYERKYDY